MRPAAAFLALLLALLSLPAMAQERVGVRVGDHPSHGRVVFDWPREVGFRMEQAPGRVTLRFDAPGAFDAPPSRLPRNVTALRAAGESVEITIAPEARPRVYRLGNRIVLDVADAPPGATPPAAAVPLAAPPAAAPARPESARPESARPELARPELARPGLTEPARRADPRPQPQSRPQSQPQRNATAPRPAPPPALPLPIDSASLVPVVVSPLAPAAAPASAAAPRPPASLAPASLAPGSLAQVRPAPVRLAQVRSLPGGGLAVPAGADVGAALFRRGEFWLLVLDAPLPLDLSGLAQHPVLAQVEVSRGAQATTLRLPAAAFAAPTLRRDAQAWLLEAPNPPAALRSILPEVEPGPPIRLLLRSANPASTLAVLDPETGGVLLVGTQREGGAATPTGRRSATLDILPTRLGVAILPRADTLSLRLLEDRFVLDAAPGTALALGDAAGPIAVDAAAMSRHFDLPTESVPALSERLRNATLAVVSAPPLGRGQPRLRAAEALLALGLPQESQSMSALAMREDPRLAESPRALALQGAAALVAGRVAEAQGVAAPGVPNSDEAQLWRGLYDAARPGGDRAAAAAAIAAGLPLLLGYPEPLRDRLIAPAAEALLEGGEVAAARRLLAARPEGDPALALARARLQEAEGAVEPALAAYGAVAQGRDRRARAIALRRAAELRLATGRLDAAGAATAVEATLAAWRGDALESEARLRVAALRTQAQDPRGAFEQLRETEALFPDLAAQLRPLQATALLGALERESPIAAVTLFDAHRALLPPGDATETALASLADRLAALDLVDRAQHVLRQALARAAGDEARARIGLRLATLALGAGDEAKAREALAETEAPGLPMALTVERTLLDARALNRLGQHAAAAARYRQAGLAGLPELAESLAERQDWAGAAAAMGELLATRLPPAPAPLQEPERRLVVRTAALLALAGQESGLTLLRNAEAGRMAGGPLEEAFMLITGAGMDNVGDLPRLRQELELARVLPERLESLRAGAPIAR